MGKSGKLGQHSLVGHDSAKVPALNSPAQTPSPGSAKAQLEIDSPPELKFAALKSACQKFGASSTHLICRDKDENLLSVSVYAEGEEAEELERWLKRQESAEKAEAEVERLRVAIAEMLAIDIVECGSDVDCAVCRMRNIARAALEPSSGTCLLRQRACDRKKP